MILSTRHPLVVAVQEKMQALTRKTVFSVLRASDSVESLEMLRIEF
jgi:hypothetical protein